MSSYMQNKNIHSNSCSTLTDVYSPTDVYLTMFYVSVVYKKLLMKILTICLRKVSLNKA